MPGNETGAAFVPVAVVPRVLEDAELSPLTSCRPIDDGAGKLIEELRDQHHGL